MVYTFKFFVLLWFVTSCYVILDISIAVTMKKPEIAYHNVTKPWKSNNLKLGSF